MVDVIRAYSMVDVFNGIHAILNRKDVMPHRCITTQLASYKDPAYDQKRTSSTQQMTDLKAITPGNEICW